MDDMAQMAAQVSTARCLRGLATRRYAATKAKCETKTGSKRTLKSKLLSKTSISYQHPIFQGDSQGAIWVEGSSIHMWRSSGVETNHDWPSLANLANTTIQTKISNAMVAAGLSQSSRTSIWASARNTYALF